MLQVQGDRVSPNLAYRKGTRYEKKTRAWLEGFGYYVVESRGSHGLFDGIAISSERVLMYQVKTSRPVYDEKRAAMLILRVPSNVYRCIVTWKGYARAPVVEWLGRVPGEGL